LPNPARSIAKARIPTKSLELPERDQFRAMVKDIHNGSSWGPKSADMIEFLAYSGLRLYTEAQHVTWEDIDWQREELIVRGSPETVTETKVLPLGVDRRWYAPSSKEPEHPGAFGGRGQIAGREAKFERT